MITNNQNIKKKIEAFNNEIHQQQTKTKTRSKQDDNVSNMTKKS